MNSEEARGSAIPVPQRGGDTAIDSLWQLKPWWCQPWSILLTGMSVIAASWWLLQRIWLTGLVALVIGAWWLLFLILVPAAWKAQQDADHGDQRLDPSQGT